MKFFSRNTLPADLQTRLVAHLGGRPRVLAWGATADGALVALHDRLVWLSADGVAEVGWHDILSGAWDDKARTMRWTRMSTGEHAEVPLTAPGSFPEVFRERVEATFLFQTAIYPRPGKAVTISARRNLMDAGDRVLWTAHPARGVRMDEEAVAFTEAELGRLRAEYAF